MTVLSIIDISDCSDEENFVNLNVACLCVAAVLFAGCDSSDSQPKDLPVKYAPSLEQEKSGKSDGETSGQVGPFDKSFDGIAFSVPAGWREVALLPQQQGFIDARFLIPSEGEELQLTFLSARGGIDSNIERWVSQFQMPPKEKPAVEPIDVGGAAAKWVELHGTFNPGPMSRDQPKENWRMIGVGIPLGDREFYLKLTGSDKAVTAVHDAFREFVKTARVQK